MINGAAIIGCAVLILQLIKCVCARLCNGAPTVQMLDFDGRKYYNQTKVFIVYALQFVVIIRFKGYTFLRI